MCPTTACRSGWGCWDQTWRATKALNPDARRLGVSVVQYPQWGGNVTGYSHADEGAQAPPTRFARHCLSNWLDHRVISLRPRQNSASGSSIRRIHKTRKPKALVHGRFGAIQASSDFWTVVCPTTAYRRGWGRWDGRGRQSRHRNVLPRPDLSWPSPARMNKWVYWDSSPRL